METLVKILALLQVLMCLDAQTKSGTVFIGTEGGSVEISCSYEESYRYVKHYFCRAPCSNSDVLIETKEADKTISKNKYTILNTVSAQSIYVNIRKLSLRDSGVYYCGVEQWGRDTLTKVRVSVKKAPTPIFTPVQSNTHSVHQITASTPEATTSETTNELEPETIPQSNVFAETTNELEPETIPQSNVFAGSKAELAVFGVLFGVFCSNLAFLLLFLYKSSAPQSCSPVI